MEQAILLALECYGGIILSCLLPAFLPFLKLYLSLLAIFFPEELRGEKEVEKGVQGRPAKALMIRKCLKFFV